MKKHYLVYKITNNLNGKIYIGQHQTDNLEDGYMGSGKHLLNSIRKNSEINFSKDILFDFDNFEDMNNKEIELVNEKFIKRDDNYNQVVGGSNGGFFKKGFIYVKDKHNKIYSISLDDPRYISKELISISKNKILVKDREGNCFQISKDDPKYLSGELVGINTGKINVKDKEGNKFQIDKEDPRYLSGELVSINKGRKGGKQNENKVNVKDKEGNKFQVLKDDPRYLSGELVGVNKGKINLNKNKINKMIFKCDIEKYIDNGWKKGRYKNEVL